MRIALLLSVSALAVGCGGEPVDPPAASQPPVDRSRYEDAERGFSVRIPPGWHRAEHALTALVDPVETLVVGTYPPSSGSERCGPLALAGFDANEALVVVLERGLDAQSEWSDFPPRPARFAYEAPQTSTFADCLSTKHGIPLRNHWFRFTDGGRHFHVLVAIGDEAPASAETEAYGLLDSLDFDASVKPDWPSSG